MRGCHVFERQPAKATRVVLSLGPMLEDKDAARGKQQTGADQVLVDAGHMRLTVYDCPSTLSAEGIAAELKRRLRDQGWKLLYACSNGSCGDRRGWEGIIPAPYSSLSKGELGYVLATKAVASKTHRVAFSLADLDQRPRVIVQQLRSNPADAIRQDLDAAKAKKLYAQIKPIESAYFNTGSSVPIDTQQLTQKMTESAALPTARWVLVGHADSRGNESGNAMLSWRRAQAISGILRVQGVSPEAVEVLAVGDLLQTEGSSPESNRRVDLFRLHTASP